MATDIKSIHGNPICDQTARDSVSSLSSSKQDKLVSGTNIKTINSTSLLGSGNINLNDTYYTETEVDTKLGTKQATLVSGTNIKTVNGTSLLGSGNITTPTTTVVDNLTSTSATSALSANQGKTLKGLIDTINTWKDGTSVATGTSIDTITANGWYHQVGDWSGTLPSVSGIEWHYSNLLAFNCGVDVSVQMLFPFNSSECFAFRTGRGTTLTWQAWTIVEPSAKQDKLVSGTNIKTVNGNSLLGSGDVTIESGSTPTIRTNIAVSVTSTATSTYQSWDTSNTYGYSATITVSGLTTNSMIQNIVMTDTLLASIAPVITTTTNGLIVYTSSATALSGTIYTLVTSEVEGG